MWADNSNCDGTNANGTLSAFDLYVNTLTTCERNPHTDANPKPRDNTNSASYANSNANPNAQPHPNTFANAYALRHEYVLEPGGDHDQ